MLSHNSKHKKLLIPFLVTVLGGYVACFNVSVRDYSAKKINWKHANIQQPSAVLLTRLEVFLRKIAAKKNSLDTLYVFNAQDSILDGNLEHHFQNVILKRTPSQFHLLLLGNPRGCSDQDKLFVHEANFWQALVGQCKGEAPALVTTPAAAQEVLNIWDKHRTSFPAVPPYELMDVYVLDPPLARFAFKAPVKAAYKTRTEDIAFRYINLASSIQRNASFKTQMLKAGFSEEVIGQARFEAVNGRDPAIRQALFDENIVFNASLMPGEVGIIGSTYKLFKEFLEKSKKKVLAVFEDDVLLPADFQPQLEYALSVAPPDWDILYMGCYAHGVILPSKEIPSPYEEITDTFSFPLCPQEGRLPVEGNPLWSILTDRCIPGGYAYLINPEGINKIMQHALPFTMPSDRVIGSFFGKHLNAYCLDHPELVSLDWSIQQQSTIRKNKSTSSSIPLKSS